MGRTAAARRLASAAAVGGGGLSLLGAGLYGVLRAEAAIARRTIGEPTDETPVPDATGWYGRERRGPAVRIALLGDSGAASYGVHRVEETVGAQVASAVSEATGRRVYLRMQAVVGARSADLDAQIDLCLTMKPEVTIILIGANDVTHRVLPSASVRALGAAVTRLREAGSAVVVGTCPDLGTVQPIVPPLRQVARAWSRRLAAAQSITVVESGGRSVSLASILGPEFAAAPALFFGPDRFHPSADGYRSLSEVLVPSVLAALGVIPDEEVEPATRRGEFVMPVETAAVQAVRSAGTELDGTEVAGAPRGLRGRWVQLRHRRRTHGGDVESPEDSESPASEDTGDPQDAEP